MTPEEIRETLFRALDRLDDLYHDRSAREELLHKEREAHYLEVRNLKAEMGRKLAEKESAIADKVRSIAEKDISLTEKDNRIAALEHELVESKMATNGN